MRGAAGIGVSTLATTPTTILDLLNSMTNGHDLAVWAGAADRRRAAVAQAALLAGAGLGAWRSAGRLAANLVAAVYAPRFVSHLMLGLALALAAALVKLPRRLGVIGAVVLIGANLLTFSAHDSSARTVP